MESQRLAEKVPNVKMYPFQRTKNCERSPVMSGISDSLSALFEFFVPDASGCSQCV